MQRPLNCQLPLTISRTLVHQALKDQKQTLVIFLRLHLTKASAVVGRGVSLKEVSQEFSQGNIEFSANSLDIAITGDGFFPLESSDGTKIFTRNGGFSLNEQNQMVNAAGQALQALPVDSTNKADFGEPLRA